MKKAIYSIVFPILLICTGAHAEENLIELKDSTVIKGNVTWIDGDNVSIQLDKGSVKTVDGQPLKKFQKQWSAEKKKESESSNKFVIEFYDDLMKGKNPDLDIDKEWELLQEFDKTMNLLSLDGFMKGQARSLKKEDVYRHFTDEENQSIVEFVVLVDKTIMDKKYYFLVKDDGSLSYVSSQAYSYYGTTKDHLRRKFVDNDKDGLADQEEQCDEGEGIFGLAEGLFTDGCKITDPQKQDTDGDGWWDGFEPVMGTDPADKSSCPSKDVSAQFQSTTTQTTKREMKSE